MLRRPDVNDVPFQFMTIFGQVHKVLLLYGSHMRKIKCEVTETVPSLHSQAAKTDETVN